MLGIIRVVYDHKHIIMYFYLLVHKDTPSLTLSPLQGLREELLQQIGIIRPHLCSQDEPLILLGTQDTARWGVSTRVET